MAASDPQTYVDTPGGRMAAAAQFQWDSAGWVPAPAAAAVAGNAGYVSLTATPTVTASAYAAGNCVGTLVTLAGAVPVAGYSAVLRQVLVSFLANNQPSLDVLLFNANPTGTTFTDKSAVAVVAADLTKICGVLNISTANYALAAAATMSVGQAVVDLPFVLAATTLYAAFVARSAFTPTGTADFACKFLIKRSG